jgi:hypothetical protein
MIPKHPESRGVRQNISETSWNDQKIRHVAGQLIVKLKAPETAAVASAQSMSDAIAAEIPGGRVLRKPRPTGRLLVAYDPKENVLEVGISMGGFDTGFTRWGYQDEEICLRAWLQGYRVVVDPQIVVAHHFRDKAGYDVDDKDVLFNFLRLIHLHFSPRRIRRCIDALDGYPGLEDAIDRLYAGDIFERRKAMSAQQRRPDEWLFDAFMPDLRLASA